MSVSNRGIILVLPTFWREHLIRVYESTGKHEWAALLRMQRP